MQCPVYQLLPWYNNDLSSNKYKIIISLLNDKIYFHTVYLLPMNCVIANNPWYLITYWWHIEFKIQYLKVIQLIGTLLWWTEVSDLLHIRLWCPIRCDFNFVSTFLMMMINGMSWHDYFSKTQTNCRTNVINAKQKKYFWYMASWWAKFKFVHTIKWAVCLRTDGIFFISMEEVNKAWNNIIQEWAEMKPRITLISILFRYLSFQGLCNLWNV